MYSYLYSCEITFSQLFLFLISFHSQLTKTQQTQLTMNIGTLSSCPIYLRSVLILSSQLRLRLLSDFFPSGFPNNI